jgi:hypothetical protein
VNPGSRYRPFDVVRGPATLTLGRQSRSAVCQRRDVVPPTNNPDGSPVSKPSGSTHPHAGRLASGAPCGGRSRERRHARQRQVRRSTWPAAADTAKDFQEPAGTIPNSIQPRGDGPRSSGRIHAPTAGFFRARSNGLDRTHLTGIPFDSKVGINPKSAIPRRPDVHRSAARQRSMAAFFEGVRGRPFRRAALASTTDKGAARRSPTCVRQQHRPSWYCSAITSASAA